MLYFQSVILFATFESCLYDIFDFIDFFLKYWNKTKVLMSSYLYTQFALIPITSSLFLLRRKRIIKFVRNLFASLPVDQQKTFLTNALILTALSMVVTVSKSCYNVYFFTKNKEQNFKNIIRFIVHGYFVDRDLIFWSVVTYFIFLNLLKVVCVHVLRKVKEQLMSIEDSDCEVVLNHLARVWKYIVEFDKIFSLLPFLWILYNFIAASATFNRPPDKVLRMKLLFLFNNVCVMFMVVYIPRIRDILRKEASEITNLLSFKYNLLNHEPRTLLSIHWHLNNISCMKMTAWKFFPFERSLILSFTATVMTFTVLFLKLTKDNPDID